MSAKEYLERLKIHDILINQKREELAMLRQVIGSTPLLYGQDKVQTFGISDKVGNGVVNVLGLQDEINEEIIKYTKEMHLLINQIQALNHPSFVPLLFKRYVQYNDFEGIAKDMGYTYQYIIEVHGKALKAFEKEYAWMLAAA